uniref:Uncharacterized protein n=1 Tax=Lates calcarifer TaxID=8187 RepID=A0A4W6DKH3_LATCA
MKVPSYLSKFRNILRKVKNSCRTKNVVQQMEPNNTMLFNLNRCITSQQYYNNTGRKKSKVRLNDQEKMIKSAAPKEHPYSSHISRFTMFPSFRSPDDPETGVRAASKSYLSPLIPNSAPDITLLSKTIGGPYRHEILETPIKTRKKAVTWSGDHIFLDPLKGENQVFYPTPPKTVLPNPKLRDWDLSLSERACNMLKNLERTHWVTSYQMHYTGSGPANPLKIDDFKEKMSDPTGMNSQTAPLFFSLQRERSYPVFVPSKQKQGCVRKCGSCVGRRTCSPTAAELLNPSSAPKQGTATATTNQHRPQEITVKHNEDRERENCKVHFDESLMQAPVSQSSQEANTAWITDTERSPDLYNHPLSQGEIDREKSLTELCDEPSCKKQYFKVGRNSFSHSHSAVSKDQADINSHTGLSHNISNPCILPRPPILPGIHPVDRVGIMGRENAALSLLDFQNAFSKSEVHCNFNRSIAHATVDLRDNAVTGKKHDFFGINCYYLHG